MVDGKGSAGWEGVDEDCPQVELHIVVGEGSGCWSECGSSC